MGSKSNYPDVNRDPRPDKSGSGFYRTGLLVSPPNREPVFLEESKEKLVPELSVAEHVLLQNSLNLIPAMQTIVEAPLVEIVDRRADLPEAESIEGIVQKNHLRVRPVSPIPVRLVANNRACRRRPISPIYFIPTYRPFSLFKRQSLHRKGFLLKSEFFVALRV